MLSLVFALLTQGAVAEIPDLPPNPCYYECTEKMGTIVANFDYASLPDSEPAVYSGSCYHQSNMYDPHHEHHGVVLLDQNEGWRFSGSFSYFAERNEFADWDLERARQELNPYWSSYAPMKVGTETARQEVLHEDGNPALIYWMRQDPESKTLYLIFYQLPVVHSFCELKKH